MTERGWWEIQGRRWKEWKTKASKAEWVQCFLSHYLQNVGVSLMDQMHQH